MNAKETTSYKQRIVLLVISMLLPLGTVGQENKERGDKSAPAKAPIKRKLRKPIEVGPERKPREAALLLSQKRIAKYDLNKDGKLDEAEAAKEKAGRDRDLAQLKAERARKVTEAMKKRNATRVRVNQFDKNGDGILSPAEEAAYRKATAANQAELRKRLGNFRR